MYQHGGDIYHHLNCIDFSANINCLGMPEGVKEALEKAINDCVHYPDVEMRELRERIAKYEEVLPEQIICGNGAAELIYQLVAAIQPKKSIILVPGFQEYEEALRFYGCQIEYYYLKKDNNFMPEEDFFYKLDSTVDMIFLTNPNNPTGRFLDENWLQKLMRKCGETGTLLIVDECFLDFCADRQIRTTVSYIMDYPNLFVLKAFTKIFAMPGIRLGYGITNNKELLDRLKKGIQPWNVSLLAQEAGLAALGQNVKDYLADTWKYLSMEKDWFIPKLKKLGFKIYGHEANYIFFEGPKGLYELLEKNGCLIRNCNNYRGLDEGYYRIAIRDRKSNEILLKKMETCVEELRWQR